MKVPKPLRKKAGHEARRVSKNHAKFCPGCKDDGKSRAELKKDYMNMFRRWQRLRKVKLDKGD